MTVAAEEKPTPKVSEAELANATEMGEAMAVKWLKRVGPLPLSLEVEDVLQAVRVAVWQAACRFDPSKGFQFNTYAGSYALGWAKRAVRDAKYLSHGMQDKIASGELAFAERMCDPLPFSAFRSVDGEESDLLERLPGGPDIWDHETGRIAVEEMLGQLSPYVAAIIRRYYLQGQSVREICKWSGTSKQAIGMALKRGIQQLRRFAMTAPVAPHENGSVSMPTHRQRVEKRLDALATDYSRPVPMDLQDELATEIGVSTASISAHISAIRKDRGIRLDLAPARPVRESAPGPPPDAAVSKLLQTIADLRRERDETAKALAEVQDERDRLKGARGTDPALATLRAQAEQLKADSAAWEARASEAQGKLAGAVVALEHLTAERDTHAAAVKRLEGLKAELERERDAATRCSESRGEQLQKLKRAYAHRSVSGLNPEGRKMAVQLAAGEPLDMRGWNLPIRITMLSLAVELLELATR